MGWPPPRPATDHKYHRILMLLNMEILDSLHLPLANAPIVEDFRRTKTYTENLRTTNMKRIFIHILAVFV